MAWKPDNSGRVAINGSEVRYVGTESGDNKGNAIWVDETGGSGEWIWTVLEGASMWVGVAEEGNFGPGYAMKGLMYGGPGNLSDGGSLVTGHWGPKLCNGDQIGMKLEVSSDRVILSFSLNSKGLGPAFDIQGWNGGVLRPVVSLDDPGQAISLAPSSGGNFNASTEVGPGIEGTWSADNLLVSIEADGEDTWKLAAKVGNSLMCKVTKSGDGFTSGPIASTRMMPPPHLQARENAVKQLLEGLTDITREGEGLRLSAGSVSELLGVSSRPGPATRDRINYLN